MVMSDAEFKALVQVAANWEKTPTGVYPWSAKQHYKSVETPTGGVGIEPIETPEFVTDVTNLMPVEDIEMPDPKLIHVGEVAGYVNALMPIILTQDKNAEGKWIILDGRHRLAAWRAAGYKQVPIVFQK